MVPDLRHMKNLAHLDLRNSATRTIRFPPSLVFLAFTTISNIQAWADPPQSGTNHNGLYLPKLKILMCNTLHQAEFLLSTTAAQNRVDSEASDSGLESLHISRAEAVESNEFEHLDLDRFKYVTDLSLFGARQFDDKWLPLFVRHLHHLQKIEVSNSDISGYGVKKVIEASPGIKSVVAKNCQNLGADAVDWARSKGIEVINPMQKDVKSGRQVRYGP